MANPPETTHDLLLQKGDGTLALVVWSERFTGGSDDLTVDLEREFERVRLYDPAVGPAPLQTWEQVRSVALRLTDHPVILEMHRHPTETDPP